MTTAPHGGARRPAAGTAVTVELDVPVPMRDGVTLRADVYRPAGGGHHPVLLGRTPYGKATWGAWLKPLETAALGYAVVINDIRGSHASEGTYRPFFSDVSDGHDTVEWAATQPWSSGRVGMFGSSACGFTQLLAAVAQPEHLVAIAPMQTWASFGRGCVYDPGGAFGLYSQEWALLGATTDPARRLDASRPGFAGRHETAVRALWEKARWHAHLPLSELPPLPKEVSAYYYEWLEHPDDDEFWWPIDVRRNYHRIQVPALHLVGWFDRFCHPTIGNFTALREQAGTATARDGQRLVVGPWPHGLPVPTACGDAYTGLAGSVDARALVLDWYDHWLKEAAPPPARPPVRFWVQGAEAWRQEPAWPPPGVEGTPFYLRGGGAANSRHGDGVLAAEVPGAGEAADSYVHDPADPVPSTPGQVARPRGPVDQRPVEDRTDVLVYTSPVLTAPLELAGPVTARLWAASSAPDTDWVVKVVDVRPDGYARALSEGMLRARYRESQARPRLLEPGQVHAYTIELLPTAYRLGVGHRLRVEVASSSFPAYDVNLSTGRPLGEDAAGAIAVQVVHHDADRPSHVVLPVQRTPTARRRAATAQPPWGSPQAE